MTVPGINNKEMVKLADNSQISPAIAKSPSPTLLEVPAKITTPRKSATGGGDGGGEDHLQISPIVSQIGKSTNEKTGGHRLLVMRRRLPVVANQSRTGVNPVPNKLVTGSTRLNLPTNKAMIPLARLNPVLNKPITVPIALNPSSKKRIIRPTGFRTISRKPVTEPASLDPVSNKLFIKSTGLLPVRSSEPVSDLTGFGAVCQQVGNFAHADDCRKYIHCRRVAGILHASVQSCPHTWAFDSQLSICEENHAHLCN